MLNPIKSGTQLLGETVELLPMQKSHVEALEVLAQEQRIFEFNPIDMSTLESRLLVFERALVERESGMQFPFVIYHKKHQRLIGSTRLMDIVPLHNKLEIGWTWLHPDYWATGVNLECKLLLLTYCFEELNAIRVQLKTDEHNMRSRKAIQKIGGQFEGILRNDMIRSNGTFRNSAYFSILQNEWGQGKWNLLEKLKGRANE